MQVTAQTKQCPKCNEIKPLDDFGKDKSCKYGVTRHCKICKREYEAKYYQENPEKFRERFAKYRQENREKACEHSKKYRQENPEKVRDFEAKYRKRNRPKKTAIQMKRHATKMQATPAWADFAAIEAIYFEAARLTQETGVQHVVDHVHPLQGYKYGICGLHVASNLKVITRSENQRKHNKFTPYVESECISTPTF